MTARAVSIMVLVTSALSLACDGTPFAETVRPHTDRPVVDPPVLSMLEIVPNSIRIEVGWTQTLDIIARDQRDERMSVEGGLILTSSNPAIVTVRSDGTVTGVAVGTTDVTVTKTIAGRTRSATIPATILRATPPADLVLTADPRLGWTPSVAQVRAGGTVKWLTGPKTVTGEPYSTLYLLDRDFGIVGELDLSAGYATHIYKAAGDYRYCTGGCWDPPEFGIIHVY